MRWKLIGILAALVIVGLGIYGWGIGLLYPCGPITNLVGSAGCRVIVSFPATQLQMLELTPDGTLLTVRRGDGRDPVEPQRLVEIDLDGRTVGEIALPSIEPKLSWGPTALSADGRMLALTSVDKRTTVLDRSTGAELGGVDLYGVTYVGFDSEDRLLLDMGFGSFERPPANVAQVYQLDGEQVGEVTGAAAAPIFTNAIAAVSTADGVLMAQHLETLKDTGIVAVRIIENQFASWAGQLLVAPLGSWRLGGQQLPELSFSPDGKYLAASFDAPDEWGSENSALIVWRIADRQVVARVPTWRAEWRNISWLPGRPAVAAQRFNLDTRVSDVAVITYRE